MNTKYVCLSLLWGILLFAAESIAQLDKQPTFSHRLTLLNEQFPIFRSQPYSIPETLNVLAAMVEFQEEIPDDERSSGNGRFDLSTPVKRIIDPPPHNKAYFEQHLTFAQNYFRKVSNGKLIVKGTVLDSIYRLPNKMQYYSPPRNSILNIELGYLMQDAWRTVDSVSQTWGDTIPFQNYKAFIIFHAGVGRDIDLVSLYGYDPTPFDIPSIYLNITALKKMFGTSYQGVPVRGNTFYINNSMIIPETESRLLRTMGGNVHLKLGINGLLVASIGSHLGLPDLFNTKTGRTGIGRFGLMDGQSIFSWGGIFPPEPSAWEKYFLGWINPITITSGDAVYPLPAVSLNSDPDSIYRVLISAKEYFLVENRNRDANRDGATVTMIFDGDTVRKTWMRDTADFDFIDQDSLYGVVIDVDEFDWSLPGGNFSVNRVSDWYDGGILIWHIDENIIESNYANGAVNANPERRGVDLEEADGSQDIGQVYGLLNPGRGSENGTPFDYWYADNPVRPARLKNEFTPNSFPNSLSNDGANSHVYIKDFSQRGPRMTVKIQVGDEQAKALTGFPKYTNGPFGTNSITVGDLNKDSHTDIIVAQRKGWFGISEEGVPANIFAWKSNGTPVLETFNPEGIIAHARTSTVGQFVGKIAVGDFDRDTVPDCAVIERYFGRPWTSSQHSALCGWSIIDRNFDWYADLLFFARNLQEFTTPLVVTDNLIAGGTIGDSLHLFTYNGMLHLETVALNTSDTIIGLSLWRQPSSFIAISAKGKVLIVSHSNIMRQKEFFKPMRASAASGFISRSMGKLITLASLNGYVYLVDSTLMPLPNFPVSTNDSILNSPALADINGDGQRDIIVFSGNKIFAINAAGAIVDNFPITVNTNKTLLTSPIVADLDGNGTPDIVAVTQEGLVVAYDRTGKMVRGFPLLAGANNGSTPAAFYMPSDCNSCIDIGLAVASDDGYVYAWKTGTVHTLSPPKMPWPQYMYDAQNRGLVEDTLQYQLRSREFLPTSLAYNWPNPVGAEQNYKTYIRYFLGENAKVKIRIFDLAGDLVTELSGPGIGGLDNEVEWDVSNIQSGVYFAHIDAQGTNTNGSIVIKIAVIK